MINTSSQYQDTSTLQNCDALDSTTQPHHIPTSLYNTKLCHTTQPVHHPTPHHKRTGKWWQELLRSGRSRILARERDAVGRYQLLPRQLVAEQQNGRLVVPLNAVNRQDTPDYHLLLGAHEPGEHEARAVAQHKFGGEVQCLGVGRLGRGDEC